MSQTCCGYFGLALAQIGVKQVFGMIGDPLNSLTDTIQRSCKYLGVRCEKGVALAAGGTSQTVHDGDLTALRYGNWCLCRNAKKILSENEIKK
jgi:Thiamine pyrophosphate enzyme, N-terminal TPP binding domain